MENTRTKVCSKEQFMAILVPVLKAEGVVFVKNGKKTQSQTEYWDLYRKIKNLEVAIAASAGTQVSLSGVGSFRFSEAGRSEESRCLRFKAKASSAIQKIFATNQNLVKKEAPETIEEFQANVADVMDALGTKIATGSPTVITAADEDAGDSGELI